MVYYDKRFSEREIKRRIKKKKQDKMTKRKKMYKGSQARKGMIKDIIVYKRAISIII